MIKIYLVRHCESEGNKSRIFQGQHDADISEKGKKQLEFLAERFRDIPLDTIYASRLMRAQKTAQAIADVKGMSVQTNNAFIEINLGEFDGKPFDYIFETNPELKHAWYYEPYSFAPPGGETMKQVYDRAKAGFKEIIENPENDGKTILIVTHGCCLRALMCSVLHGDIMRLGEMKGSANTAVTLLVCNENGVKAEYMCDASHLPEEFTSSTKNVYTESR
ncbi:MAG: histidine phosphatase family protein [Clostridia bacterium]|nr:histidine phosphatase family protein [Clostridia bacterium]